MFRDSTCRIIPFLTGFWIIGQVDGWSDDDPVYKHGMRIGSPLKLLPRVYGYTSKNEWPEEVKPGCDITKDFRQYSTYHHPETHNAAFDPVNQFKWTKMQYLVTARVDRSLLWNPLNLSMYFIFLATMSEYNVVAVLFDLTTNRIQVTSLDESMLASNEWKQAYHVVHEQHNKEEIGLVYPRNGLETFNATFGIFVVIDHDATYEAVYTCYRDTAKFRRSPYNTFCEKFYEKKKFIRYQAPARSNVTYVFLPGVDWVYCNYPVCDTAKNYSDAEAIVGCSLYNRSSYEWICNTPPCSALKFDRPFETAQRIALTFRTADDKKLWKG